MTETSNVMACPRDSVIVFDGEGVDSVKGLEMMEVRQEGVWGENFRVADVDLSGVLEEAALTHVR
jgi:hypothetical protein